MSISGVIEDRRRRFNENREKKYLACVNYVAENNLEPTHGAYGGNMGLGVQGYTIKGCCGVVFLRDEDVNRAKARLSKTKIEDAQEGGY